MTPRRRRICRPLARGSRCAFARKCLTDYTIRNLIVKGLGRSLRCEIARLCSDDTVSILRDKASNSLEKFTWEKLLAEVKAVAPTLLSFFNAAQLLESPEEIRTQSLVCWWPLCVNIVVLFHPCFSSSCFLFSTLVMLPKRYLQYIMPQLNKSCELNITSIMHRCMIVCREWDFVSLTEVQSGLWINLVRVLTQK